MRAEMPYLAAGTVAVIGGTVRHGGWPPEGVKAVLGTLVLVIVASTTNGGRAAPLVRAFGLLILIAAVMAAVTANQKRGKK
jgi:hypothetical protein